METRPAEKEPANQGLLDKGVDFVFRSVPQAVLGGVTGATRAPLELGSSLIRGRGVTQSFRDAGSAFMDEVRDPSSPAAMAADTLHGAASGFLLGFGNQRDTSGMGTAQRVLTKVGEGIGYGLGLGGSLVLLEPVSSAGLAKVGVPRVLAKYPGVAKYAEPVIRNAASMALRGQVDRSMVNADFNARLHRFASDVEAGGMLTAISAVTGFKAGFPAMFAYGYLTTPKEAPIEDKVLGGVTMAALHGAMGLSDRPLSFSGKPAPKVEPHEIRSVMQEVLSKYGGEPKAAIPEKAAVTSPAVEESPRTKSLSEKLRSVFSETAQPLVSPITGTHILADNFERSSGIPVKSSVVNIIDEGMRKKTAFVQEAATRLADILGEKMSDVAYMDSLGKLGVATDGMALNSTEARAEAAKLGLGDDALRLLGEYRSFLDEYFYPIAKGEDPSLEQRKNYYPQMRGGEPERMAPSGNPLDDISASPDYFAVKSRNPNPEYERATDIVEVTMRYANALANRVFLKDGVANYEGLRDSLPPWVESRLTEFVNSNVGVPDTRTTWLEDTTRSFSDSINKAFGTSLDLGRMFSTVGRLYRSQVFAETLGIPNMKSVAFQVTQPIQMGIAAFGPKGIPYINRAYESALDPMTRELAENKGWYRPDAGADKAGKYLKSKAYSEASRAERVLLRVIEFNNWRLGLFRGGDTYARIVTGKAAWDQFNDAAKTKDVLEGLGMTGDFPYGTAPDIARVKEFLDKGDLEGARDAYVNIRLNETQLPQSGGEFPSRPFGKMGGRSLFTFASYPLQTGANFISRFNIKQKGIYVGTAISLVSAFRNLGTETRSSLGPSAITGPFQDRSLFAVNMVKGIVGGLYSVIDSLRGDYVQRKKDVDAFVEGLRPLVATPLKVAALAKSMSNNWAIYNSAGNKILVQGSPWLVLLKFLSFTPNRLAKVYAKSRAEVQVSAKNRDLAEQLSEILREGTGEDLAAFLKDHPEMSDYKPSPTQFINLLFPQEFLQESLYGVPKRDIPEVQKRFQEIDAQYK